MKRIATAGLLLAAVALLSPARADEYADRMSAGEKGIDDARFKEAAAAYEKAEELSRAFGEDDERHLKAMNGLADALSGDDQNARAESIVKRALELAEKRHGKESALAAQSLRILGDVTENLDRKAESEGHYARALEIRRKSLGADHPDTAESLNIAGNAATNQQRYRDAEKLLRDALAAYEKAGLAAKAATVRNNLGYLFAVQENPRAAEAEYRKCLEARKRVLRADHPDIGAVLSNLADACATQGKDAEAEAALKEAIAIGEKNDPQGTNLAYALHNLACLRSMTGRHGEAFPLFERSRAIWEKLDGPESEIVANACDMHAQALEAAGRKGEAAPLAARAAAIRAKPPADPAEGWRRTFESGVRALNEARYGDAVTELWRAAGLSQAFGEGDERHIRSLLQLATAYRNKPDHREAESVAKRALALAEKSLGKDAPELAGILNILALVYDDLDRAVDAEPLYQRALSIRAKALGADHPDVAQSVHNLALVLAKQRKHEEAEKLLSRALRIFEKAGRESDAAFELNALGYLHLDMGKAAEAEKELRESLARYEKAGVTTSEGLCDVCFNLGDIHRKRGEKEQTEALLLRAAGVAEKLGPEHPQLAKALHNLAVLHMERGVKLDEADALFRRSRAIWEKVYGPWHPQVAQSYDNHARLLGSMKGREAEAAEMRRKVEEIRARRR